MSNRAIFFFCAVLLASGLTGCYKKMYLQTVNEKVSLVNDNQNLHSENSTLKSDNSSLNQQVLDLKSTNQALTNRLLAEQQKTKRFDLFFRQLCCDQTNDPRGAGADEVFITIAASKLGSGDVFTRLPGATAHWDMNDGNQPSDNPSGDSHCLTNKTLFSGELKPGESYYINLTVQEEDGGNGGDYQAAASALLIKTGNPYAVGAGVFLGALKTLGFFPKDSDDWMGMFGVKVTNNDGVINVEWQPKTGIVHMRPDLDYPTEPNRKELRMNHDGSDYVGWFGVRN